METNQNEQFLLFIQQLLETIQEKGVTPPAANPSPLDDIWSEITSQTTSYKKRIINDVIAPLQSTISKLEQENAELKTTQKNQEEIIRALNDDLAKMSELEQDNAQLKKELQSVKEQCEQTEKQLSERIGTLEKEKNELTDTIKTRETDLEEVKNGNTILQSQLDDAKKEGAASRRIADQFELKTAKWKMLLEKVLSCQIMRSYCEKYGLNDDGEMDTLLHFISLVGDKTGFARTVRNILVPDRNTSDPPALNADAIGLIQAVNHFYLEKYGDELVGDVLFMPEGFSFNQPAVTGGIQFNQAEMQQFKGNNPFVCKVLAPGYREIDGSVVDKASVL